LKKINSIWRLALSNYKKKQLIKVSVVSKRNLFLIRKKLSNVTLFFNWVNRRNLKRRLMKKARAHCRKRARKKWGFFRKPNTYDRRRWKRWKRKAKW
jgi:hypothetical protein